MSFNPTPSEVICLSTSAFESLITTVLEYIDEKHQLSRDHQWIGTDEAMKLLNIKSKTTLQTLRDTGKIRYSQPQHKIILYDRISLLEYIEQHAKETF